MYLHELSIYKRGAKRFIFSGVKIEGKILISYLLFVYYVQIFGEKNRMEKPKNTNNNYITKMCS